MANIIDKLSKIRESLLSLVSETEKKINNDFLETADLPTYQELKVAECAVNSYKDIVQQYGQICDMLYKVNKGVSNIKNLESTLASDPQFTAIDVRWLKSNMTPLRYQLEDLSKQTYLLKDKYESYLRYFNSTQYMIYNTRSMDRNTYQ